MPKINNISPGEIFAEFKTGTDYKAGLGKRGIAEQSKVNERFFVGDQWHGVNVGPNKPLVRRNLIKRIGEYKIAMIGSSPIAVNYSAEGVPNTLEMKATADKALQGMATGSKQDSLDKTIETNMIMNALSQYFSVTAERVKLDDRKHEALKNAYISGTSIGYTYWDETIRTGLYADEAQSTPINGDINFEILDIENVVFGEPNKDDVQSQPYISICQRLNCEDVRRYAKAHGISAEEIEKIKPSDMAGDYYTAGEYGQNEPQNSKRVTVVTKFYKKYDDSGKVHIMAVKVCENAIVRKPWDTLLTLYPFAKLSWETRKSSIYGDSEITYLIPNQIAINRALTASVWAMIMSGMPITVVNGDIVSGPISNNPGEIITVYGDGDAALKAVRHISPPAFEAQYRNMIDSMANDTLTDSGATSAALGDLRMENASAMMQLREASALPLQPYKNRFYSFCEDIARIWADFWVNLYGNRQIKMRDSNGEWYLPFNADNYKNYIITARIDVGAATVWSEAIVVSALDSLLQAQLINFKQYLERLPEGYIPNKTGLLKELEAAQQSGEVTDDMILEQLKQTNPEVYAQLQAMPPEQQAEALAKMRGA